MPLSVKDTIQGTITNAQNAATADTAGKLSANAGSTTQPIYFSGGKPVATSYTLAKSVPADAKFTDTNTWRGIQNNLTSDSTTDSLSAAQGKALKGLVDGKAASGHTHTKSQITDFPSSLPASDVYAWAKASTKPSYTKSEVGLSNVDNTADSAKSVKYATSAGSAGSAGSATNDSKNQAITGYIRGLSVSGRTVTYTRGDGTTGSITTQDTNTTYGTASQSANGLMSAADKKKLDGIANGANNFTYSLPTASATVLGGVKTGSNITNTSGVLSLTKANVTSALGYTPPTTNTTYGNATTSSSGLMSSSDKSKLDGIAIGANKTVVDNALSQSSANPVANSAVTKRLQFLYSFKISRDKWNESSDKSNWNVIVPWSDSKGNAITATASSTTPNLTTNMSLGPAMMERTSSLKDNIILSGELSMINQGQIYVCDTNKLSFTVKRRPVCDLMLYFYARQWTT